MKIKLNILNIVIILSILLSFGIPNVLAVDTNLNWSSVQTISQISNITIPSNNSYIGAIQLTDIDAKSISSINISSTTYSMNISIVLDSYIFGLITPVTITTDFQDKILHKNQSKTFTVIFPPDDDILILPQYTLGYTTSRNGEIINIAIYNDQAYWKSNVSFLTGFSSSRMQPLINNPYNTSNLMRAMPSKTISIQITGSDKVDVSYIMGTSDQIGDISSNFQDSALDMDSQGWMIWALSKIPWIGVYLASAVTFLSLFFGLIFSLITFLIFDLDIIFLLLLSFSMLHGIIIMASGGTPYDGVKRPIEDIIFGIKGTYTVLIMFFTLIWNIVRSIATIIT